MYSSNGTSVNFTHHSSGEVTEAATCATPEAATRAADLLQRARRANDFKRQYTKAARLIAEAETVDGFKWSEAFDL